MTTPAAVDVRRTGLVRSRSTLRRGYEILWKNDLIDIKDRNAASDKKDFCLVQTFSVTVANLNAKR